MGAHSQENILSCAAPLHKNQEAEVIVHYSHSQADVSTLHPPVHATY